MREMKVKSKQVLLAEEFEGGACVRFEEELVDEVLCCARIEPR
jgi:hypothetical protein